MNTTEAEQYCNNTTEAKQYCNICEHGHVFHTAAMWCPECDDFLCSSCDRVHAGSKASEQHVVIKIEDYQKLPDSIVTIKNRCYSHQIKYEFYCTTHSEPCCVLCTRNEHRDCKHVCSISEVTQNAKSSTALEHLERDLGDINIAFKTVESTILENISEIRQQKTNFLDQIEKVRKTIDDHLDRIERQVIDDLSGTEQKLKVQLQELSSDFDVKRKKFNEIRQDLETVKQYGSNLQTFMAVNEMVASTDDKIKKMHGTLEFYHYRIEFDTLSNLQTFLKNVPSFGIVSFVQKKCVIPLVSGVLSQVQIPTLKHSNKIPIAARKTTVQLPTRNGVINVHGSEIMPDGKLVFADTQTKTLIIRSSDGKYEQIRLPSEPYEVKSTDSNDVVAVTLPESRKITFVNTKMKNCIHSINTVHQCFGSDTSNQKLIVRAIPWFSSDHVIFYSLEGDFIRRVDIPGSEAKNISVQDNIIACSDRRENTVHMYNTVGERSWTFKDTTILRGPIGVAIDKRKNIFVAGNDSNNIVVIKPDGRSCTEFLSEGDGLKKPYSLRLNIDRGELLVCNEHGPAFLVSLGYT